MKIFVSWSGTQAKAIAESIRIWLPKILMAKVDLFVSSQDIAKGERGLSVIADQLEGHNYGIVVLTRSNLDSPWVNFEAGALAKLLGQSFVSPVLLDITDADVVGPLSQFQSTALTDKEDVWALVRGINKVLGEGFPDESIRALFDTRWDEFEKTIQEALAGVVPQTSRAPQEILEEVLETVRGIARNQSMSTATDVLTERGAVAEVSLALAMENERQRREYANILAQGRMPSAEDDAVLRGKRWVEKRFREDKLDELRLDAERDAALAAQEQELQNRIENGDI